MPSPKGGPRKAGETPRERCEFPEPRRKLDAGEVMSETPTNTANGTAGRQTDWTQVNWRQTYKRVRNLRQRIFRATQEGDYKKVRSLQKLMLRSYSNTLVSVRQVTQLNKGRSTAGVDKVTVKTPEERGKLVDDIQAHTPWKVKPAKRVYIPKKGGRRRPLGIPAIRDRVMQAVVKNALEPEWEARFEATSYGFRPGRGCHDAIQKVHTAVNAHTRKVWVVDADIEGCFDNISHDYLMRQIRGFPARHLIKEWLKAGYVEMGSYHRTTSGTPQGGVVSPLLANIALHGLEKAVGVKRRYDGRIDGSRSVVRYADDFVIFCESKEDAESAKADVQRWLKRRGLTLSEDKTHIVHMWEGFDFLGFNVRHYEANTPTGKVCLIKPSKKSTRKLRERLREEWKQLHGNNIAQVISRLNPIIRGWANYYRSSVAKKTFQTLDNLMWRWSWKWARRQHPNKSRKWVKERYFGRFNLRRKDNWVMGDHRSGAYLLRFQWTPIRHHTLVRQTASPDDPALRDYWHERRKKQAKKRSDKPSWARLAREQGHVCPVCGQSIYNGEEIHRHHRDPNGDDSYENLVLLHLYCHQQAHATGLMVRKSLA